MQTIDDHIARLRDEDAKKRKTAEDLLREKETAHMELTESEAPASTIFNAIVYDIESNARTREMVIKLVAKFEHDGCYADLLWKVETGFMLREFMDRSVILAKVSEWKELGFKMQDYDSDFARRKYDHVFTHADLVGWAIHVRFDKAKNPYITVYRLPFWRRWM